MNNQKRKSLDEISDESEEFESQFERIDAGENDESVRARLIAEIGVWLQDVAKQGRFIPLGSADRRAFRSLLERWHSRLRTKGHYIEGIDSLADFDPSAGIVLLGDCPYPGLEPYTQHQRGSFFGRDALVSSSVTHLNQQGNRILLIIGASGSGKSSLALAGILPRLRDLHEGAWLFGPRLTPAADALKELAASVAQAIGHPDQAGEIANDLAAKPDEALAQMAELCQDKPLMLLIDQFEELLTLCHDASKQSAFAQVLCALSEPAASVNGFSCRILLTLRTDHLARFESNNALKPLHMRLVGENNELYLSAIGFSAIKRAIKEPADEVGLRFIPAGLIDQMASQTAGLTNGLPLLQFALRRLWDMRPKNESGQPLDLVTERMVQDLPDVERALGTVAESVFRTFSFPQQKISERLLLELIVLDESFEEPLRRRRNETELVQVLQALFPDSGDVTRVIEEFVAAGLLRRFGEGPNGQLEVAHEALLRHWDQIYRIVTGAEAKERLHLIKQIGRQAGDWTSHDKSSDYLSLKGERLHRALAYSVDGWLAEADAQAYVDACRKQEEEEQRKDELAKGAELRVAWYKRAMGLVIFVSAAGFLLFYIVQQRAETQRIAEANKRVSYGFYYLKINEFGKAEESFNAATESGGGAIEAAWFGLGQIYLKKNEFKKSKDFFQKAIDLVEKNGQKEDGIEHSEFLHIYYFNSGQSCSGLKKHAEAITAFNRAIELLKEKNPDDKNLADWNYQLGLSYLEDGKMKDAEVAFKRGLSLGGDKEAANRDGLGQLYLRQGEFQAASAEFEKAIGLSKQKNIDPDLPGYRLSLAQASLELNQFAKAEQACKDAIASPSLRPQDKSRAYILLGNSREAQWKYKEAINDYKKALESNPCDAFVALYLAGAYNKNQNRLEAEEYVKKAEEFAKSDPQLQAQRAEDFFNKKIKQLKNELASP